MPGALVPGPLRQQTQISLQPATIGPEPVCYRLWRVSLRVPGLLLVQHREPA